MRRQRRRPLLLRRSLVRRGMRVRRLCWSLRIHWWLFAKRQGHQVDELCDVLHFGVGAPLGQVRAVAFTVSVDVVPAVDPHVLGGPDEHEGREDGVVFRDPDLDWYSVDRVRDTGRDGAKQAQQQIRPSMFISYSC